LLAHDGIASSHSWICSSPFKTFGDLAKQGLQMRVACQGYHRQIVIEVTAALRDRPVAGQRFRCKERYFDGTDCRGIGLPTIEHQKSWVRRQAEHSRQLAARKGKP
jgi:hypothetical protein